MTDIEMLPQTNGMIELPPPIDCSHMAFGSRDRSGRIITRSRPSLPTLHTHSTYPTDYSAHYDASPIDAYTYSNSTVPRHDSFASTYGLENYRSWSTSSGPMSAPATTTTYYDPSSGYSFGSMQAPSIPGQQHIGRLPSVTADSISALNMGHLHSSLPAQTVQERRLPIPALQYPQTPFTAAEIPEIRPLGSYTEPRVHITGIHSRNAMPWSGGTSSSSSRRSSIAPMAPPSGMPHSRIQTTTAVSEPVLSYQWSLAGPTASSSSPEISPTSGTAPSDGFVSTSTPSTTSVLPPSSLRYLGSNNCTFPPATSYERPCSLRGTAATSLYSFSTDAPSPNLTTTTTAIPLPSAQHEASRTSTRIPTRVPTSRESPGQPALRLAVHQDTTTAIRSQATPVMRIQTINNRPQFVNHSLNMLPASTRCVDSHLLISNHRSVQRPHRGCRSRTLVVITECWS